MQKLKQVEKEEPDSTDTCDGCRKKITQGYHCIVCCKELADLKDKKAVKDHDTVCTTGIWLNPLSDTE